MGRSRIYSSIHRPTVRQLPIQRRRSLLPIQADPLQSDPIQSDPIQPVLSDPPLLAQGPNVLDRIQSQNIQSQNIQSQRRISLSPSPQPSSQSSSQRTVKAIQPLLERSGVLRQQGAEANSIQRSPDTIWGTHESALDAIIAKPHRVRQVLRDDFYSNWFMAKDYLVANKWDGKSKAAKAEKTPRFRRLMRSLLDVRADETNALLSHIRDVALTRNYPKMKTMDPAERLSWSAAGSETLTSDIDVNLKGAGAIQAVGLFNKLFKTKNGWPYDPGTVYDVNVYAQDFMTPGDTQTLAGGHKKLGSPFQKDEVGNQATLTPVEEVDAFTDEDSIAFEAFSINQDVWAMTKMRMHMTDTEWDAYKDEMLGTTMTPEMARNDGDGFRKKMQMRSQLSDAEHYYRRYKLSIDQMIRIIDRDESKVYQTMRTALAQGGDRVSAERKHETKEMMAANILYEEKLERVQFLRDRLDTLKTEHPQDLIEIKQCGLQLKNALSEAIMFSNEAYFSQGAVQDVVLGYQIGQGMQKKKRRGNAAKGQAPQPGYTVDLQLANDLRLQSMREQVGDTLKVLNEYAEAPVWKAVFKAGKYIDRMILAATPLLSGGLSGSFARDFQLVGNLGQTATRLKADGANETTQRHDLNAILAGKTMANIRSLVIRIGTTVDQNYHQVW